MVLPVVKLGTLVLKTLSKPIAARIKKEAGLHPKFRQHIVNLAQANHRLSTTMQRRIYGHATDVEIRPLNEEKAVQAAVDLLGEIFVFSSLRLRDEELAQEVEHLKHQLEELERLARGRGLPGVFNFRHANAEDGKLGKQA
ncbi:optic atrophy 3 protein [Actinidia rufa]|uniref:Optic atrophy 3 protein n=1 Tax=Actinidia rufa TaxID=165716 RepID=A0A7J0F125_9ERIC|nr:optic atrophy 3 protein [Actinidia rufa]